MRVLVLSDTHIPVVANELPDVILQEAKKCDICLHAGDLINYSVFKKLSALTVAYGVCGNMDDDDVRKILPAKQIVALGAIKAGLVHGRGNPNRLIEVISEDFEKEFSEIDIFVFGHSHYPWIKISTAKYFLILDLLPTRLTRHSDPTACWK